jgi:GH24 family phage-related lysozyme (muramidase)
MKTSQVGIDFIKEFEAFEPRPYRCSANRMTIGYGHVIRSGEDITVLTEQQASDLLAKDLERFEADVLGAIDVPLEQHQFDALVSLAFNIGGSAFKGSTLARILNEREYKSAAEQVLRWDKVNGKPLAGLTRRRKAERAMFLGEA